MTKPQYSENERAFIKKWGVPSELEFDNERVAFTGSGKTKITALFLAKQRKKFIEESMQGSNNRENL